MKTAFKNRQNSVTVNNEISTSRAKTDAPEIQQAWVRLYEAIMGKRRMPRHKGLAYQH